MTIKGNEDLELIADGDGDGWVKVKKKILKLRFVFSLHKILTDITKCEIIVMLDFMNMIF